MDFNSMLKTLRKNAGLTQTELAEQLGVSQVTIVHYEQGKKKPEMDKVPKLAKILGVSIEELFGTKPTAHKGNTKSKFHGNKRVIKLAESFEKLKPAEQRLVLSQVESMAKR